MSPTDQTCTYVVHHSVRHPLRPVPFLLPWATEGLPDEVSRALLRDAGTAYRTALRISRGTSRREEPRALRHV